MSDTSEPGSTQPGFGHAPPRVIRSASAPDPSAEGYRAPTAAPMSTFSSDSLEPELDDESLDNAELDEAPDDAPPTSVNTAVAESLASIVLSAVDARVIGALIEKEAVTPDVYPMTTKGLATACNQKTNRDPVVDYSPVDIDAALLDLRQRNLVRRVHSPGSRSTKHRHTLDEALSLDPGELALMAVLLLRGAQTIGELRLRTERQFSFDSLEAAESTLRALADRAQPLVRQLERQPGHKEARWIHLLGDGEPPVAAAAAAPVSPSARAEPAAPAATSAPSGAAAPAEPSKLEARVVELESEVATLRRQLTSLAGQLGESLD